MRALSLGELEGDADAITGVQVDSRRIRPGDLFVAVSGGEAYLDDALRYTKLFFHGIGGRNGFHAE